jgi:hypothetical protein
MSFNPSKCNIIHISRKKSPLKYTYHLKGEVLEEVDTAVYLGISITKDLTWHNQVSKAASKGNRALGFVRRNIRTASRATKERAYQTLVRPVVEYGATVWDPHQKHLTNTVEMVQRRAARYVTNNYDYRASVTSMLQELKWESLEQRRLKARVTMGYKIIHGLVAIPTLQLIPTTIITRGNQMKFIHIQARTNYYKFSFFPAMIPLWNSLPQEVAEAQELEQFKQSLAKIQLSATRR